MTTMTPRAMPREAGFTLIELMIASLITMVVMGVAFTTFDNALSLNESVASLADSTQNLRVGTNLLIRDLMQAGRNIPIGGIAIPSGTGSSAIKRPSPPDKSYTFDNTTATTLSSITTGSGLGPTVDGRTTDMVTVLMDDPILDALTVYPSTTSGNVPKLTATGDAFSVGTSTTWLQGDADNGVAAIKAGDLIYFLAATGTAIQTVTKVDSSTVYFESNDPFNFNQRGAAAGSITPILGVTLTVRRIFMYTYYVHEESAGTPRLTRALNMYPATALAGVIEDLDLNYDIVDGVLNPVNVADLPYTANGVTYTASQIRKVNAHLGVRSESKSRKTNDYLRNHVSTVISLRNLAYVDRYQ
jgi:Tfp pilus assembly protein PilW